MKCLYIGDPRGYTCTLWEVERYFETTVKITVIESQFFGLTDVSRAYEWWTPCKGLSLLYILCR